LLGQVDCSHTSLSDKLLKCTGSQDCSYQCFGLHQYLYLFFCNVVFPFSPIHMRLCYAYYCYSLFVHVSQFPCFWQCVNLMSMTKVMVAGWFF
jgi:hypothetical protein